MMTHNGGTLWYPLFEFVLVCTDGCYLAGLCEPSTVVGLGKSVAVCQDTRVNMFMLCAFLLS